MKISKIKINGYGKLINKEIELEKGMNVIYGKNESGKSTILSFINSIFYGVNKNKNGQAISDYDRYLPWRTEEFSGEISYEIDNGEKYDIFRDFRKKLPVIYNQNKQDISIQYAIDKSKGIDFIGEQIGVDEETFKNTMIVAQNDIKMNASVQNSMIQKISNIVSSGDETVSFQKTLDRINKQQLENVGSDRTREKPINIINNKINSYKNARGKLEIYKSFLEENDQDVQKIQEDIDKEETILALYRVLKESKEKSKGKNKEIEVIQKIRDEYFVKIEELDEKIDKGFVEKVKKEKKSSLIPILLISVSIILAIICFILHYPILCGISCIGIAVATLIFDSIRKIKFSRSKKIKLKELSELENKIEQEINILRSQIRTSQAEIDSKQEEIREAENEVNRLVMNRFEEKLDAEFIGKAFELESGELENKIADKNDKINSLKIEKGAKQNQKESMQEELDELAKIKEELDRLEEEKKELESLNVSYDLAKEGLENAYENIRNSLSPEFTEKLSKIAYKVSNGKYKDINFIDTEGLIVQVEDGRFLPVERLSQGTIDQMYLGLRLASIDTITNEKMPIILDETFAFFDEERLQNILDFIRQEYPDRQVIIFSCSTREVEALKRLNVEYHFVEI